MRFLFVHSNYPAQFRHIIRRLAADPRHQVRFISQHVEWHAEPIPGVERFTYHLGRPAHQQGHPYLERLESAVLHGQAVARVAEGLKRQGWVPDLMVGHSGFGATLYLKDVYPQVPFVGYFEWYYNSHGSDVEFIRPQGVPLQTAMQTRSFNATTLMDLAVAQAGLTPTRWQWQQFPELFRPQLTVIHDGIDSGYFAPAPQRPRAIPGLNLDLAAMPEIVTYATRGMEPYRGFPQFMAALSILQQQRPQLQAIIVGADQVFYGNPRPDGRSWRQACLQDYPLDPARIHFTGPLSYPAYRTVLQASDCHCYLTYPFVLSWSLLEAMSCGCAIVASATAPVQELIEDGVQGRLVDFYSPDALAGMVGHLLDHPDRRQQLGRQARARIQAEYEQEPLLVQQLNWLKNQT